METHQNYRPGWDAYFMALACVVASRSPDPSTKHGTVIVDDQHRILGLGYNGFPRKSKADYPTTRPEKYDFIVHSELNALLNYNGRPEGATVYVTGMPCPRCMVAMVQAGIKTVIYGQTGSVMVPSDIEDKTRFIAENHGINLIDFRSTSFESPLVVLDSTLNYMKDKSWQ